jgi:hypothetical protein
MVGAVADAPPLAPPHAAPELPLVGAEQFASVPLFIARQDHSHVLPVLTGGDIPHCAAQRFVGVVVEATPFDAPHTPS